MGLGLPLLVVQSQRKLSLIGGDPEVLPLEVLVHLLQLEDLIVAVFYESIAVGNFLAGDVPLLLDLLELELAAGLRVLQDFVGFGQEVDGLLVTLLLELVLAAPLASLPFAPLDFLELGLELAHQELEDLVLAVEIVDAVDVGLVDLELGEQVGGLDLDLEEHLLVLDPEQVLEPLDLLLVVVDGGHIHPNLLLRHVQLQLVVQVVGLDGHLANLAVLELALSLVELRRTPLIQVREVWGLPQRVRRPH